MEEAGKNTRPLKSAIAAKDRQPLYAESTRATSALRRFYLDSAEEKLSQPGAPRVLAQEAEIILADEPVSNLDPELAEDIVALFSEVCRARRATLLVSLHQPEMAAKQADRIIGLHSGQMVYDQPAAFRNATAGKRIYSREETMNE